jgi:uncharacterized protein (TIRG00374 family)
VRASSGPWLIGVALVASVAIPLWLGGLPALDAIGDLSPHGIALVLVPTLVSWLARAAKLRVLTRRLGLALTASTALNISLATDFGFLTTPGGLGGYAANALLLRRAGATASQATAVVAADQIIDAVFFAIALPVAAMCAIGSAASPVLLRIAFVGGVLLSAGAFAALTFRRPLIRLLARMCSALAARSALFAKVRDLLARAADETAHLLHGGGDHASMLVALTALQWIARYGILWMVLCVFGHDVPYGVVLLSQALVMHAAQWSGVPAGAGAAELGLAAALTPWLSASAFAPVAIVWRVASLHLAVLVGGIALVAQVRRPHAAPVDDARPVTTP